MNGRSLMILLDGRIEGGLAESMAKSIPQHLDAGHPFVLLNFEDAESLDSTGLRAVLMAAMRLKREGRTLAVCSLREPVMRMFQTSGLDQTISIYPDPDSAMEEWGLDDD